MQNIPGTPITQTIFLQCCSRNDRKRAARSLSEIGRLLFSLFLSLFCPSSHFSLSSEEWQRSS